MQSDHDKLSSIIEYEFCEKGCTPLLYLIDVYADKVRAI
jgi:hypothetical protein